MINNSTYQTFLQQLKPHSQILLPHTIHPVPLVQQTTIPYDYYFERQQDFQPQNIEFYQVMGSIHPAITPVAAVQIHSPQTTFFKCFSLKKNIPQKERMSLYFKYLPQTLADWIQLMSERAGLIPEDNIFYLLDCLLHLANGFRQHYGSPTKALTSTKIYLTTQRTIQLYPFSFSTPKLPPTLIQTPQKEAKYLEEDSPLLSESSTMMSSRHLQFYSEKHFEEGEDGSEAMDKDQDLVDLILLVMELLTFRKPVFFFDERHKMVRWDLVRQYLASSEHVGHLSTCFINTLKKVSKGEIRTCKELLTNLQTQKEFDNRSKYLSLACNQAVRARKEEAVESQRQAKKQQISVFFPLYTPHH